MTITNHEAAELNSALEKKCPAVLAMLSERGKNIYFPKKGILSQSADAKGKKINATLGTAVEDDGTPMRLGPVSELVSLPPEQVFPYAPSFGHPPLRTKWRELIYSKNPGLNGIEISQPVVTCALTHGLSVCGYLFADPGTEIILPDIFWDNYSLIFENGYGAALKTWNFFNNGAIDTEALKKIISADKHKKKVVLLNFPNNPTGYTPTHDEANTICRILADSAEKGNAITVILDDAYIGLEYEPGIITESLFARLSHAHENILAVKLDGITKEDYAWGFRVGFITFGNKAADKTAYSALENKAGGAVRGTISNAPLISQSLILKAFTHSEYSRIKKEKYAILKKRYDTVRETLARETAYKQYFTALPFNSGYFMCVTLKNGIDGEKVRKILLDEYDCGVINMAGVIRVAYSAIGDKSIGPLFKNLYEACKKAE